MVRYLLIFLSLLSLPIHAQMKHLKEFVLAKDPNTVNSSRTAIIICPGGSYSWLDGKTEGTEVARWLNSNGISAFVLSYPVQNNFNYVTHARAIFGGHQYPDQINCLQNAIKYVRTHAKEFNIDPHKIGVMGFSAGGHLAMSSAEFWNTDDDRPDFVAPIYPVVSMSDKCTHKRSRRALLGERGKRNKTLRESQSLEKHVPTNCPPVFLVNCLDDHVVKPHNSVLLDSALTAKGVNHKYIQYKTGGHGFGASEKKGTEECRQWKAEFLKWLKATILSN